MPKSNRMVELTGKGWLINVDQRWQLLQIASQHLIMSLKAGIKISIHLEQPMVGSLKTATSNPERERVAIP